MRRQPSPVLLVFLVLPLVPTSEAGAQFGFGGDSTRPVESQQSDIFRTEEEIPTREELEENLTSSPWKFGIVRLSPWLGLNDARLISNEGFTSDDSNDSENPRGAGGTDFTATVGAGLRSYVKLGSSSVLAAHALPEYVWWQDDEDRRGVNGRYGVGLFTHLNRLSLEVSARREERQALFASDLAQLATTRSDISRVAAEVKLTRRIEWFTHVGRLTSEADEDLPERFRSLDRETDSVRTGLRWAAPGGWTFSLGAEEGEIRSSSETRNLSADSSSVLTEVRLDGNRVTGRLSLARRELEPTVGSELPRSEETTGSLGLSLTLGARDQLGLFATRDLRFSSSTAFASLLSERLGVQWAHTFPRWKRNEASLSAFVLTGTDDFEPGAGSTDGARSDDVIAWGAWLSLRFRRSITFLLGGSDWTFDSPLDDEDRQFSSFGLSIQLDFNWSFQALGFGPGSGGW